MPRVRLFVSLLLAAALLSASSADSASSDIVISQVYAGGGNAGASYANDFVELFNPGEATIDLSGWTVQYASAASTTWQTTALSGSIPSGRYYLVQLASAAAIGAPPTARTRRCRDDEPRRLRRQGRARARDRRPGLRRVAG